MVEFLIFFARCAYRHRRRSISINFPKNLCKVNLFGTHPVKNLVPTLSEKCFMSIKHKSSKFLRRLMRRNSQHILSISILALTKKAMRHLNWTRRQFQTSKQTKNFHALEWENKFDRNQKSYKERKRHRHNNTKMMKLCFLSIN